ncbi:hypothetical protein ACJMK2_034333 [Sinanodonta woodiana]|uniref:Uncharacterized protein n=1 Tax=Sinanodonta woodiana TaxID=1069815 RepID=A0ABD3WVD6_SINWO
MSVDDLVQILPKLGDRIALKLFVDEEIKKKQELQYQWKERKAKLIQSLCAKLCIQNSRINIFHSSLKWRKRTMARHCNRNAFKENRKVELGWIHNGKQVRTAKGGGTRKIELPRNSRKEVLDKAKTLFFPTNHAPLDSIVDFILKLTDFSNREIQNETIEELYESSKVSMRL